MTIETIIIFSLAVTMLIISPGPSVAVVVGRTLGSGFRAGMTTALGVYFGGATYLVLSFAGLTSLSESAGPIFTFIRYLGACYLIWYGWKSIKAASVPNHVPLVSSRNFLRDLSIGLMVTLGNPKPIVFYSALLPSFMDMSKASTNDLILLLFILAVSTLTVQGVYAYISNRTRRHAASEKIAKRLRQTSGGAMIVAGTIVALQ